MPIVPFAHAEKVADRFLDLLRRHSINPANGSMLEGELLSLVELLDVTKTPSLATGARKAALLAAAAGVHDMAAKILAVEGIDEFDQFVAHLGLIAGKKLDVASLGQLAPGQYNDDTGRKMVELYIAALVSHFASEISLDHPTNSKGDNPDVMFTYEPGIENHPPLRWALAIKTIRSKQGQTIFERIAEGSRQIDSPQCKANVGMVVINTRDALDHAKLYGTLMPDLQAAQTALLNEIQGLINAAAKDRDVSDWELIFAGRTVRPVLWLGQTVVRIADGLGNEVPTALKAMVADHVNGKVHFVGAGIAGLMNHFMQIVLSGVPGRAGQFPS
ncbi:hypothetical protein ELH55_34260 (plasmid) [Rhizobium ruizarguesonis]|uniref:hypothetical protein n=1 Tax=Rhizobium ruizarguesonis TaxID=2081791 RepID=UPI001031565D|nr:hypothetical protein [Rhizobium ruizarguesonis]TBA94354.1 hypothetical protein ELH55_34260 [Rhizobium ruizarguesonis]